MKEVKLTLVKTEDGISATNESNSTIDYFDESEESRKEFVKYLLDEFINKEVGKVKYQ